MQVDAQAPAATSVGAAAAAAAAGSGGSSGALYCRTFERTVITMESAQSGAYRVLLRGVVCRRSPAHPLGDRRGGGGGR